MARKATAKGSSASKPKSSKSAKSRSSGTSAGSRTVARTGGSSRSGGSAKDTMSETFINLLQSPLVADLLAVAATAALAALAEHGFSNRGAGDGGSSKRAGKAVKEAGKAAAAAIGRRLSTEIDEIRQAAKASSAKA